MAGIYIHIPFCKTKCSYCDFFSKSGLSNKRNLVGALTKELLIRTEYLTDKNIETIYFGGGTPSLLEKEDFDILFETIYNYYTVDKNAEITLEANPDDLNQEYISMLTNQPFNRLSIGIQSLQDNELKVLNRRHTAQQAITAIKKAQQYGFNNISIDLMYGLPLQSMETWVSNLKQAISLDVQHISAYNLTIEKGTPIYKEVKEGKISVSNEDECASMFYQMKEILEGAGYEHYEISNFAKKDYISCHNSSYWKGKEYLGIGPSAHSFNGINRSWNVSSLTKYLENIQRGMVPQEIEVLTKDMQYNDYILTSLRTKWGINLTTLREKFGEDKLLYVQKNIHPYLKTNDIQQEESTIRITHKGLIISDRIMSDLMYID